MVFLCLGPDYHLESTIFIWREEAMSDDLAHPNEVVFQTKLV